MKRILLPAGGFTLFLSVVLFAAVVTASRPGVSPGGPAVPLGPASAGAAEDDLKGTVWVVNRDLGELAIFDAGTGDLLKTLAVGRGAHDICISEQTGKAYITAETDNVVTVVDTETLAKHSITVRPAAASRRTQQRRSHHLRQPGVAHAGRGRRGSICGHRHQ